MRPRLRRRASARRALSRHVSRKRPSRGGPAIPIAALVAAIVLVIIMTVIALADDAAPVSPRDVHIIDGDTIWVRGETFRLVGFDAPEIGRTARCEREVDKGYEAKAAVVDLVHSGKPLTLQRIACSCPPPRLKDRSSAITVADAGPCAPAARTSAKS